MERKYDIRHFFLGELYFTNEFQLSLNAKPITREMGKEKNRIFHLISNGAYNFQQNTTHRFIDWKARKKYHGILTIFFKEGQEYICLHDGNTYSDKGDCFFENLVPLINLLPQVAYDIPSAISTKEAIRFFEILIPLTTEEKIISQYQEKKYPTESFYIGNLNLHVGFQPDNNLNQRYQYDNLVPKYMLYKNCPSNGGILFRAKEESKNNYTPHHFRIFKSLFLKEEDGLYNIHNCQKYQYGTLKEERCPTRYIKESYFDYMKNLKEDFPERRELSIPEALSYYQKVK